MAEIIPARLKLWRERAAEAREEPILLEGEEPEQLQASAPPSIVDDAAEYEEAERDLALLETAFDSAIPRFRAAGERLAAGGFAPRYEKRADAHCAFLRRQRQAADDDRVQRIARRKALAESE